LDNVLSTGLPPKKYLKFTSVEWLKGKRTEQKFEYHITVCAKKKERKGKKESRNVRSKIFLKFVHTLRE